jgi:hypothetical protein
MTATISTFDATADMNIRPATLVELHKPGFKLIALSSDHKPMVPWTQIYDDPNFWTIKGLIDNSSKFENVATVFGKTHTKDREGRDLYLNDLDGDSEPVYKIMTTPIESISDALLRSKLQSLFSGINVLTEKKSVFDCLREVTIVVKTRKPYGFQAFWLSHKQHDHVGCNDCKLGYEFEIKTDKSLGHATLPPSTHRSDKTFRYSHIGRKDRIEILDGLHDILLWLLKECIKLDFSCAKDRGDYHSEADNNDNPSGSKAKPQRRHNTTTLYDLSDEIIQTTVSYFTPYYQIGQRNNFALALSGVMWYAKISEDSAGKILQQLSIQANNDEIKSRLVTLHATYEKAIKGESVTGGPTLAVSQLWYVDFY